jgi:TRAP-type mannitol/chloroaromatic compound transport system permease small subunit
VVKLLVRFADGVDWLNERIGRTVAWLVLAMVLITFGVAILRYVFSLGFVWLQESYVWLHAIVFMAGAAYTLLHDGHVRVDVIYRPFGQRYKAWVDLLGGLVLLLPMVVAAGWVSFPYVLSSWDKLEASREAGGLPALFLLKSFLLVFCVTVALQGLSLAARSLVQLMKPETRASGS